MRSKKALVTGVTGFVGSHLAVALMNGGWEVHSVIRGPSSSSLPGGVKAHIHDGTTEGMVEIVKDVSPEVVFHLASLFLLEHGAADVEPLVRSNVLFGTQLLEGMRASGVTRLVNTGTSWQHFENSDYNPVCLYAATKQAFEAMISYYVEVCSLRAVTLKLYDTYGPGDTRKKLFALLGKISNEGTRLDMSPGQQLIDIVYIDDVVDAFMKTAGLLLEDRVERHEEYAVSSGKPIRLRELVEKYAGVTGRRLDIAWGARPYRPREVMVPWDMGRPVPGWEPMVGLDDGIRRIVSAGG